MDKFITKFFPWLIIVFLTFIICGFISFILSFSNYKRIEKLYEEKKLNSLITTTNYHWELRYIPNYGVHRAEHLLQLMIFGNKDKEGKNDCLIREIKITEKQHNFLMKNSINNIKIIK